jgi:ABC-type amino acid transport substrate-binding protein
MTERTNQSPLRRTATTLVRFAAAGSLATGLAVAAFAAPAQADPGSDGTRVTVVDPDGTRVTETDPDGTRVTGTDPDGTRVTGTDPDGTRVTGTDPDGTRVTNKDWS